MGRAVTVPRDASHLNRETVVVGSVGSMFTRGQGIRRGLLNW
jgi:hypothetical protein